MILVKRDDVIDAWCLRVPKEDREDFPKVIRGLPSYEYEDLENDDVQTAHTKGFMEGWHEGYEAGLKEGPKGEWIRSEDTLTCPNCKIEMELPSYALMHMNFCPSCGCDMRKDKE